MVLRVCLGLGLGLEEVFAFDGKSENRDRAVEAVELGLELGLGSHLHFAVLVSGLQSTFMPDGP